MGSNSSPHPNNFHSTMDTINSLTTLLSNLTPTEASTLQPIVINQTSTLLHHLNSPEATISTSAQVNHLTALIRLRAQFARLKWPSPALTPSLQNTITHINGSTPPYLTAIMAKFSDLDSHLITTINALLTQSAPEQPVAALQHYAALLSLLPHLTEHQLRGSLSPSVSPSPSASLDTSSSSTIIDYRKSILRQIMDILSNPAVFNQLAEEPLGVLVPLTSIRQTICENGWGEENRGANLDSLIGRHAVAVGINFLAREKTNACEQGLSAEEREANIDEPVMGTFSPLLETVSVAQVEERDHGGVGCFKQDACTVSPALPNDADDQVPVNASAAPSVPVEVQQQPPSSVIQEKEKEWEQEQEQKQESPTLKNFTVSNPLSSPLQAQTNPLASLFAERAARLEAQLQKRRIEEREAARAKAKAREETIAADPTKAEQRKYAEDMKEQLLKKKEAKEVVLRRIEADKIARREKAEQIKLRREQVGLGEESLGRGFDGTEDGEQIEGVWETDE